LKIIIIQTKLFYKNVKSIGYCKRCGIPFDKKNEDEEFCCEECSAWYSFGKEKKTQPMFRCPKCNNFITLDFDPKYCRRDWFEFSCPKCGFKNKDNDFKEISKIKSGLRKELYNK